MRGLPALLLGSFPATTSLQRGVMIMSCPAEIGGRVLNRLREWTPGTSWQIVKREEPSPEGFADATRFTTDLRTAMQQWGLIRNLRSSRFDIAVAVWDGTPGYGMLKFLPLLVGARSVLIFNENIDAFYLLARNRKPLRDHWRSRRSGRPRAEVLQYLGGLVSSLVLAPLGLMYLLIKVSYLVTRKYIRKD